MTLHTFGASFGADPLPPRPVTTAQKTEARTKAEEARLAALPVQCQAWSDRLDLADLECMAMVAKAYEGEGMAPIRVNTADLARRLKTDERDAADRLERCIKAGAVERTRRIAAAPTYRPCARGTDARPVTVTGKKGESSTFAPAAPGSLLGLRRRD